MDSWTFGGYQLQAGDALLKRRTAYDKQGPLRYQLVIFDFDGTLADSFPLFLEHMGKVIDHFKLRRINENDLDELRGLGAREIIDYLKLPYWKVPVVANYMRRLMAADVAQTRLFAGSSELLRRLHERGVKVAIVSSNSEANVRTILGPKNIQWIDCFECGSSLFGKAAKFRKALKKTGVSADHALTIGDEIRDMEAARKAQIDFGAVSWGYTKVEALETLSPTFVFHQADEILIRVMQMRRARMD